MVRKKQIKKLSEEKLFPYKNFPFRIEHPDGDDLKVCWFKCEWDLEKYVTRHSIKKRSKFVKINKL